jgi:four helix bundle protein
MLNKFRAYQDALKFYDRCEKLFGAIHLRNQLLRASSSIVLNLAEGSCQPTQPNRARYYRMALGSLRESQALLAMMKAQPDLVSMGDSLGAQVYKLCKANQPRTK